jgi:hypothetical protein
MKITFSRQTSAGDSAPSWQLRCCAVAALLFPLLAHAQAEGPRVGPTMSAQNPCRDAVSKFEQNIGLIRRINGEQKAAEFKRRYLPPEVEMDLLTKEGYCGLASYLRKKKLID